jgi:sortase (surface protein transpeptidase)
VVLLAIAATLVVAGVALLVLATTRTSSPPQPSSVAAAAPASTGDAQAPTASPTGSPTASPTGSPTGSPTANDENTPAGAAGLARSQPVHVDIPSIGVSSSLLSLGLNADGTMEVPPFEPVSKAGWYRYSPTPGEIGPAVIVGHIDSAQYGPGVFSRLAALSPGELVSVTRADNTVVVFRVAQVATYSKTTFPTQTVYGNTDRPALRLITCGGSFDATAHSYRDNTVVYADVVGSHPVKG